MPLAVPTHPTLDALLLSAGTLGIPQVEASPRSRAMSPTAWATVEVTHGLLRPENGAGRKGGLSLGAPQPRQHYGHLANSDVFSSCNKHLGHIINVLLEIRNLAVSQARAGGHKCRSRESTACVEERCENHLIR